MTLLDDAKIITTANAGKAGTLYSIKPDSGLADLDITRATTATRVDSVGVIESVAINEPQLDYTDGSCPSFLVEPQRTNLFTYSTGLPSGGWGGNSFIFNADTAVAPDGTTTANTMEVQSTSAYAFINVTLAASTTYTFSFYAKRGTATQMKYYAISLDNFTTLISQTDFYPLTNSSTWTRISSSFTTDAATTSVRIYYRYVTPGTGTFYLWGLQLEEIPASSQVETTSYIPTSGATVTRNRTIFSKSGLSSLIGQTEGVFFLEMELLYDGAFANISIGHGNTDWITIGASGSTTLWLSIQFNSTWLIITSGATQPSGYFKIAAKYKSGDSAFWVNGSEITTSTTTGTIANNWDKIESNYIGFTNQWPFYGKIKQIQVYDTILTDAQLLALTT